MAVISGHTLSVGPFLGNVAHITNDISTFNDVLWVQPPPFDVGEDGGGFVLNSNLPVEMPASVLQAVKLGSYFENFYYRVMLIPSRLDLGNLLSVQSKTFGLWNAWLDETTVNSVTATGMSGLSLSAPAGYTETPFVMEPNLELTYTLQVTLDGSPTIDASIHWDTDRNDVTLNITGARVIMFPFKPDWSDGIDETISTRSILTRSITGSEQTISVRDKDRRSFAMKYVFGALDSQRFDNLMFGWQSRLFGVPMWPEEAHLTSNIAVGDTEVQVNTYGRTFVPGGLVMVYDEDVYDNDVREIASVTSSGFTVSVPFNRKWDADARIAPVGLAQVNTEVSTSRLTPQAGTVSLTFDFEPSVTDPNMPDEAPAAMYLGAELYPGRTNWRDPMAITSNSDVVRVDQQTGRFLLKALSGFSGQGRSHDWFMPTIADVRGLRAWLKRRRGKTHGVWMPSGLDDFTLALPSIAADNILRVHNNGYSLLVAQHPARRDIYIRFSDGTFMVRRIANSSDDPTGKITLLSFDQPLGRDIDVASVRQFSFLGYYRMTSDDTQIHWHTPGIAEATTGLLSTKSLT